MSSINQFDWQNKLFYEVSRQKLMKLSSETYINNTKLMVKVYRNHSFELIESVLHPYLNNFGLPIEFSYGDYDDSLSFGDNDNKEYDAYFLWIDLTRYKIDNSVDFIVERVKHLEKKTNKPVLLGLMGMHVDGKLDNTTLCFNVDKECASLKENLLDLKKEPYTGTRLSNSGALLVAKRLGSLYFPALFNVQIKAVVVDLDNTLYKGVLGEDGQNGVMVTEGHSELQKHLHVLSKKGFFICVVSKNEQDDVISLFKNRTDFHLKLEDITIIKASWDNKSKSILNIIKELNIGSDSVLFIDDNIGEQIEVKSIIPNIKQILASENANFTVELLKHFPGTLKFRNSLEDSLRSRDVQANLERESLKESMSREAYLKALGMELTIRLNDIQGATRTCELANKTNQFIFTYQRYTQQQIDQLLIDKNSCVVTLHLKDKLSDSGMIGGIILKRNKEYVELEEMYISCRALGRGVDDIIIGEAILKGLEQLGSSVLKVNFKEGERNKPAKDFYKNYLEKYSTPTAYSLIKENAIVKINII